MKLADQHDRDKIADALDDTLVVEAAAGTGKTTELVKRILRVLASGRTTVGSIVAVTFTEKAAGELKLRLREALERERAGSGDDDARQRLDKALGSLEEAHVSTIHGFCAELLRERPVEAGVDPLFRVLTDTQSARLFEESFGGWLQAQLADPPEGVRRALRRSNPFSFSGPKPRQDGPIDRLRRAAWELTDWRDFPAPWTRPAFERDARIEQLVEELHAFAALTEHPSYGKDYLYLDTAPARHLSQEIQLQQEMINFRPAPDRLRQGYGESAEALAKAERAEGPDYDGWEARLVDLSRDRNF